MLLILTGLALVALFTLPDLIRNRMKREGIVFGVLFLITAAIAVIELMGLEVLSPVQLCKMLLEDVLGLSYLHFSPAG